MMPSKNLGGSSPGLIVQSQVTLDRRRNLYGGVGIAMWASRITNQSPNDTLRRIAGPFSALCAENTLANAENREHYLRIKCGD
jgi:hypothetical protein